MSGEESLSPEAHAWFSRPEVQERFVPNRLLAFILDKPVGKGEFVSREAVDWYKDLNIHQRIFMKEMFPFVTGWTFTEIGFMFTFQERVTLFYNKCMMELSKE